MSEFASAQAGHREQTGREGFSPSNLQRGYIGKNTAYLTGGSVTGNWDCIEPGPTNSGVEQ